MTRSTVHQCATYLDFYTNAPLLELGAEADRVRREKHPHNTVTYIVDRNINYTNVCVADCGFCAFYRRPKHPEGWTLSFEQIGAKIDEAKALGGVQILMQGGHNPVHPVRVVSRPAALHQAHHPIHIHGFSPSEVDFFAKTFRMDARDVIRELVKAGLDSIPGGGGEILVQRVRDQVAKKKAGADRWLEIMEIAHQRGDEDVRHDDVRHRRDARRAHRASRARARRAGADGRLHGVHLLAAAAGEHADDVAQPKTDAVDYLRTVAIARIVLDNVPNLQASWVTMGLKVGQMALRFGCNDFGSLMIEENVVSAANTTHRTTIGEMERLIRRRRVQGRAPPAGLLDHRGTGQRTVAAVERRRRRVNVSPRRIRQLRVGIGYDSHRFAPPGPLVLGGVPHSERRAARGSLRRRRGRARADRRDARRGGAPATSARCSPIAIRPTRARTRSRCCAPPLRASLALGWRVQQVDVAVIAERRGSRRTAS